MELQVFELFLCQLKHKIFGKPVKISADRFVKIAGGNLVKNRQVLIQYHFLCAYEKYCPFNPFDRNNTLLAGHCHFPQFLLRFSLASIHRSIFSLLNHQAIPTLDAGISFLSGVEHSVPFEYLLNCWAAILSRSGECDKVRKNLGSPSSMSVPTEHGHSLIRMIAHCLG